MNFKLTQKNKQKIQEILKMYIKLLQKECHIKGCENFRSCPQNCCNPRFLNTDTAIAWELAKEIRLRTENLFSIKKINLKYLKIIAQHSNNILDYHYNKNNKIKRISTIIDSLYRTLRNIHLGMIDYSNINILKEEIK